MLVSLVGVIFNCSILVNITERRNNDGSYSSNSYGGYYGGDDKISYSVLTGLFAAPAILLIGE